MVSVTRVTDVCCVTLVMLGERMGDWSSDETRWGIRVRVLGTFRVLRGWVNVVRVAHGCAATLTVPGM